MTSSSSQEEKQQRERDELLDAAVFELNQKINLTVSGINEEKSNVLMDILRVQLMDIVHELDALRVRRDEAMVAVQSERVRQWLNSLNRSPLIPLSFRIRHLRAIEGYLDVIARDMSTLLIRAYKIGILHIKEKAVRQPRLYQDMVHVVGIALELAVKSLLRDFSLYLPPPVLDIRQNFDMARLGLVIARTLDQEQAASDILRLKRAMIQHELLRCMDMFSLTVQEQQVIAERLITFADLGDIEFLRSGESPARIGGGPYLISRTDSPHMKPYRSRRLSNVMSVDVFLIHAEAMFRKAADFSSTTFHITPALNLESDVVSLSLCASMLLRIFRNVGRASRQDIKDAHVQIKLRRALANHSELLGKAEAWSEWHLVNLSARGAMLESGASPFPVATLLELKLPSTTRYGLVRWYKASLQGGVRTGIEYISPQVAPAQVTLPNFASSESGNQCWAALLEKVTSGWNVWLGDWSGVPVPMTVSIKREGKSRTICRLIPTGEAGANYAVFHITEVMHETKPTSLIDTDITRRK